MRLPDVDQKTATALIKRAVELGVKYIETSPGYGDSEEKIGRAVEELGCRKEVLLSTKSSSRRAAGMRADFERSLKRMRADRFDFYHMWYVNGMGEFKSLTGKGGAMEEAKKARSEGLFDHLGITTHAKNDEIKHFIDTGEFELVTLYYNAYDTGPAEAAEYAKKKGLGVVCMGPLKGGFLADASEKLAFLRDEHSRSNAQGALRWLAADAAVSIITVGYSEISHLDDAYEALTLPSMAKETRRRISKNIRDFDKYKERICSCCNYCREHCPEGVQISEALTCLAQYEIYGIREYARRRYGRLRTKGDACSGCGKCMEHCPQKLNIPELLEKTHASLGAAE